MDLVKLETREQFRKLKRGDLVVVKWQPGAQQSKRTGKVVCHYSMLELKERSDELILQKRDNVYFNIEMYLNGGSWATEAFVIADGQL